MQRNGKTAKEFNKVTAEKRYITKKAKILVFDIETAPMEAYVWGAWDQTVHPQMIKHDWYTLCWAAKWTDQKKVMTGALPDFPERYKEDKRDDYDVILKLRNLLDEADIVIGHNIDKFDIKKVNARIIEHGIEPPSPYKTIDTLKIARKHASFTHNKLDYVGDILGVGRKVETGGFDLWLGCMAGDEKAWKKMLKYNKQDVVLNQEVYEKLKPYISNHPEVVQKVVDPKSVEIQDPHDPECPCCASKEVVKKGTVHNQSGLSYQRYKCNDCHAPLRSYFTIDAKRPNLNKPLKQIPRR